MYTNEAVPCLNSMCHTVYCIAYLVHFNMNIPTAFQIGFLLCFCDAERPHCISNHQRITATR